jgi:hypothetical protein
VQHTKCGETFAYIADIYGYGIIVYDYQSDKSWRVNHNYFSFDPIQGDLNVANVNFQWHDGVFGMALGDVRNEHGLVDERESLNKSASPDVKLH